MDLTSSFVQSFLGPFCMVFSAWIAAADEVEKELQCCNTQIEDLDCERKMGLNQNMIFLLLSRLG